MWLKNGKNKNTVNQRR